jgi:cytoskeletal protein CcmA (bactofilin family)
MSVTVISKGMCLEGGLRGAGDLNVYGEIQGSVHIDGRACIEQSGLLGHDIEAREVWVAGEVRGNIQARVMVHVTETGRVLGDVSAPRVNVDAGAVMKTASPSGNKQSEEILEAPIIDVISQTPRRVASLDPEHSFDKNRLTARPRRRRVMVKKRARNDK